MDSRSVAGRAVVVGAGVMGGQIAAHLANAGWNAVLLDIVPDGADSSPKSRNGMAANGLERTKKARPAAFFVPENVQRIELGNIDDNLARTDYRIREIAVLEDFRSTVPFNESCLHFTFTPAIRTRCLDCWLNGTPSLRSGKVTQCVRHSARLKLKKRS